MVTVSWLQSDINALPKGIFLTHFVQLLLFSSGPDPKPIRSVEGFSSIQKAIYSVCNRNFQSTIETMGTCVQDWTKSMHFATEKKRRGFAFFFFLMNSTRVFVWCWVGPNFHFWHLPSSQCQSTSPPFGHLCSKMLAKSLRLPSQSPLEDLVTESPNLWHKWPCVQLAFPPLLTALIPHRSGPFPWRLQCQAGPACGLATCYYFISQV